MTPSERIAAEKSLAELGNSIIIKDYGLALAIMHRQLVGAQKPVPLSINVNTVFGRCEHDWDLRPSETGFYHCIKCPEVIAMKDILTQEKI